MSTEQATTTAHGASSSTIPIDERAQENLRNLLELASSEITLFSGDETLPLNRILLDAMLVLLESKRPDLFSHCQRVSLLCFGMGQHIGWSHRHTLTLATAGILHEIGALVRSDGIPFWSTLNSRNDLESRNVVVDLLQACHAGSDLLDLLMLSHNFAYRKEQPEELPTHVLESAACLQFADLFDSVRNMPHGSAYSAEEIVEALQAIVETPHESQAIEALQAWLKNDPADRGKLDPNIFTPGAIGDDEEMMAEVRLIFMQILSQLNQLHEDYDGYFLLDSTGHFHLWNTGCVKLLGRTIREMRNKYWTNHVMGYCNEEGMAFSDAHTPLYRTLETAQTSHTRLCLQSVAEEIFQADIYAVPLLGRDRTLQGIVELIRCASPREGSADGEPLFTAEWISELAREISEQSHALLDDDEEEESEWDSFLSETESSLQFRHVVDPPPVEENEGEASPAIAADADGVEPAVSEPDGGPVDEALDSPAEDPGSTESIAVEDAASESEHVEDETTVDDVLSRFDDIADDVEQSLATEPVEEAAESAGEITESTVAAPAPAENEIEPPVEHVSETVDDGVEEPETDVADAEPTDALAHQNVEGQISSSEEAARVTEEPELPTEDVAAESVTTDSGRDSEPEPGTEELESILYDDAAVGGPESDLMLSDMPEDEPAQDLPAESDAPPAAAESAEPEAPPLAPQTIEPAPDDPPAEPTPAEGRKSKHVKSVVVAEAQEEVPPPEPAPVRREPRTPDVVPQTVETESVAVAERPDADAELDSHRSEWNTDVLIEPVTRAEWDAFVTNLLEDREPDETFTVFFLDIDRFGVINKEFGRQIGNDLIREIGRRLSNFCNDRELACRYGGEQFVLLSPDLNPKQALKRAELIRKLIASTKFDVLPFQKVTTSIGVTEAEAGDDLNSLLDRAENALQRAKRNGRNCTVAVDSKTVNDPLPEDGKSPEQGTRKKLCLSTSFDAFIASDMIVYKLGGFLYENQAKLLEVDRRHVSIRVGTKGLIPYWGRKEESQPVTVELELGEDWEKAKSSKVSVTNTTIQVTIRPEGWVRRQDVFEHRANHVLRELKAHFAAR